MTARSAPRKTGGSTLVAYVLTSLALASAWHIHGVPSGLWLANGVAGILGLATGLWALRCQGGSLRGNLRQGLLQGALLGLVLAAATQLIARGILVHSPIFREEISRLYALLRTPPGPVRASPTLLLVVLAEELVFRGAVTTWLEERLTPRGQNQACSTEQRMGQPLPNGVGVTREGQARQSRRAHAYVILASSTLYALPLLASGSWLLPLLGFGLGVIWTAARLTSKGLTVPLLAHALFSVSTFVCLPIS